MSEWSEEEIGLRDALEADGFLPPFEVDSGGIYCSFTEDGSSRELCDYVASGKGLSALVSLLNGLPWHPEQEARGKRNRDLWNLKLIAGGRHVHRR